MPQEPIVFNQDPGENFSQSPPQIDHHCCHECSDSLNGIFCKRCTCKSCGKGAHYGYNCPPKVPIISNPEPCHDQNVDEFPQTLTCFHPTCYSGDENSFTYDSTPNFVNDSPNVFNPPPQPLMYSYEFCWNDAHYSYDCPPQIPFICDPEPCYNQDFNFSQNFQSFQPQYPCCKNCGGPHESFRCQQVIFYEPCCENCEEDSLCYDDDDDEESSTPLRDIILFELPLCIAITPILSTREPKNSLIVGDEHLDTIPEKESNEFIKSSVDNLIPNPSKFEDERECGVPACDDFTTFSNLLFDVDNDFSSSDNELFSDEDILKEIYSNLLFDEEIIDSLLDEFTGKLIFLKSIPPGIDEADCDFEEEIRLIEKLLYDNLSPRPPEEIDSKNSDAVIESFSTSPIPVKDNNSLIEEIDLSLTPDDSMPPGIEDDDYDSEGDILSLKELLSNDSLSPPENESFHFDIPSSPRPPAKPPDDDKIEPNSRILTVKVVGDISKNYVLMPRPLPTQPTLALNQEKSPHILYHRGLNTFQLSSKSPMMIYGGNIPILDVPFLHFYPP
nr:hypothetical protein [Tanacetum cinerariifolium]